MVKKVCYNMSLLQEVCERDKCIIDFDKIEKYNRKIRVDFICNCGIEYSKTFRQIYDVSGGYCKKCTENRRREKVKQTCIDRYGVSCSLQSQEVKDKSKQTCVERYGVLFSSQSQEVKDKSKQTCIERYGVECPMKSQEVKDKHKHTCIKRFGVENPSQSQKAKDKYKQTCFINFGVEYPLQSQEVKDKKIQTCIKRFGVENPSQSQKAKDKSKQTCIERYGVECPMKSQEVKDKSKQTCFINFGVEYPLQSQEVRDKKIITCILNYGVEYPMQNAEISEKQSKNAYKHKVFVFPCGNTIQVQGYEPILLKNLVEEGYTYEGLITDKTEVPEIWYEKDNNKHRYYCDVYVPKINTIYEVKSTWTNKKDIDKINLTKQACIDAGYLFELYVYDAKGIRQQDI